MIHGLVDIGKDMNKVTCNEKIFYEDQKGPRECHISRVQNMQSQKN